MWEKRTVSFFLPWISWAIVVTFHDYRSSWTAPLPQFSSQWFLECWFLTSPINLSSNNLPAIASLRILLFTYSSVRSSFITLLFWITCNEFCFPPGILLIPQVFVKSIRKVKVLVAQLSPTLYNPMDCSLPGSSVHGIFQARILKWVAISFTRGYSQHRDPNWVSCTAGRLYHLSHQGIC